MTEVQAGFDMYCNKMAAKLYGRTLEELTEEERAELMEAIPFRFERKAAEEE